MAIFIDTVQVSDPSALEIDGAFFGTVKFVEPNSADAGPRPATSLKLDQPGSIKEPIEGLQVGDSIDIAPSVLRTWTTSSDTAEIAHTQVIGGSLTITMSDGTKGSLAVSGLPPNAVFTVRELPSVNGKEGDYALTYQLANPKIVGGSTGGTPVKAESTGNSYLDSMIWGWNAWNPDKGPITYWFGTAADVPAAVAVHGQTAELPLDTPRLGTWTDEIRDDFIAAVDAYAAVSNLAFARASSVSDADLVWWLTPGLEPTLGRSEGPASMPGGQIWTYFNDLPWTKNDTDSAKGPQQLLFGGDGNNTIVHEIGHSLGLAHPHDGGGEPNARAFPGIPAEAYPKTPKIRAPTARTRASSRSCLMWKVGRGKGPSRRSRIEAPKVRWAHSTSPPCNTSTGRTWPTGRATTSTACPTSPARALAG
jgi:serralysin